MNSNARIYICTHTDFVCPVHNQVYETIDARNIFASDKAENGMDALFYSEMLTYKYLAEHWETLPDIVGFCGYRKYYSFMDDVPDLEALIKEHGCIATTPRDLKMSVYQQYALRFSYADMDIMRTLVRCQEPWLWPAFRQMLGGNMLYTCNMFVMRRNDFLQLVNIIWKLLDAYIDIVGNNLEQRIINHKYDYFKGGLKSATVVNQSRMGGHLSERITSAYIASRFPDAKTFDIRITEQPKPHLVQTSDVVPRTKNQQKGWITVAIVHYNTPELTRAAIRSLLKTTSGVQRIVVFDNSTQRPFTPDKDCRYRDMPMYRYNEKPLVEVIDNTRGQIINWEQWLAMFPEKETGQINKSDYGSAKHCRSVQWLIDNIDEPFLLMDSDVLVRCSVATFFDRRYATIAHVSNNTKKRFNIDVYRAEPFLCYLNVPMLRKAGVRYFNPEYMWAFGFKSPNNRYDTGAWFLEDCKRHNLPYRDTETSNYILHLGHASWRNKDWKAWLNAYKTLHEHPPA